MSEGITINSQHAGHQSTAKLNRRDPRPFALINMPFGMVDRPSIQCGLLKAAAVAAGHRTDVYYLNVDLAAHVGWQVYKALSSLRANLLIGEWLFSVAAYGDDASDDALMTSLPALETFCRELNVSFDQLRELRRVTLPAWIGRCVDSVDWSSYLLVGFTSTFEQNNAGFALARALKARWPTLRTIFGGANFDGEMGREFVRTLPFVDYAVVGEGDRVLPEILDRLSTDQDLSGIGGLLTRVDGAAAGTYPAPIVTDLDSLPDPDYSDYFHALARFGADKVYGRRDPPLLLVESSRGCWWGQKHHCTFCGLNANGMTYRSKRADATIAQLARMSNRYQLTSFEAVDNILDYKYLEELCEPLAQERVDIRLFYEVKANLKREQLHTMARAGIRAIQPGIESLSSHILSLMRKGTSMLQNIRCLKWAHYYGIDVYWNILTGFPGERDEDYSEQERVLPLLKHLTPPKHCGRIWLERFSPYFFDRTFPIKNVRPLEAYRVVYPERTVNIDEVAYFFQYDMDDTLPDERHARLHEIVGDWQAAWVQPTKPNLFFHRAHDWIGVLDRRTSTPATIMLNAVEAAVYEGITDSEKSVAQLVDQLKLTKAKDVTPETVERALASFCDRGLAIGERGRFLGLALPTNRNW